VICIVTLIIIFLLILIKNNKVEVETNQEDICKDIQSKNDKYDCYLDLAIKTKNSEYCGYLPGRNYGGGGEGKVCLINVFIEQENVSMCAWLYYSTERKECFRGIFKKTGDTTFCNHFEDLSFIKQECIESTQAKCIYRSYGWECSEFMDKEIIKKFELKCINESGRWEELPNSTYFCNFNYTSNIII